MTRINTNVSSLIAQKTLQRSNAGLQESLTRLSTGLRINVGKDDPAGLIASEALRSDIISVNKAITNSERANQLIATADSALGQVSSLLNDIRGLVSEAANVGALSDDQVAANQLQIDSSLEAIDRIAQITSFQGKRLLDGNLDFISNGVSSDIQGLQIDQANFGTQTKIGVDVNVVKQATRAELRYAFGAIADSTVLEVAGANGTEAFQFAAGSTIDEIATAVNLVSDATGVTAEIEKSATTGSATISSYGANNDITLTANKAGESAGNIRIKYTTGTSAATTVNFNSASGSNPATIDVQLQTQAHVAAKGVADDKIALSKTTGVVDNVANHTFTITDATGKTNTNIVVVGADLGAAADATVGYVANAVSGDTVTITYNTNGAAGDNSFGAVQTLVEALNGGDRFSVAIGGGGTIASDFDQAITDVTDTVVAATSSQSVVNSGANSLTVTDSTGANDTKIEVVGADLGAGKAATVGYNSDATGDKITITYNTNASPGDNTFGAVKTAIEALDGGSRFTTTYGGGATAASTFNQADALNSFTGGSESLNNALAVSARLSGADFNGVTVNFVNDGQRSFSAISKGSETLEYSADAKASQAILNFSAANTDLVLTAAKEGAAYNEVSIVFDDAGSGGATKAAYDADAKTLTISIDFADNSIAISDIKDAIDADGTFTAADGNGSSGAGNIDGTNVPTQGVTGNTGFSGGDAKTLYVYIDSGATTANDIRDAIANNTDQATQRAANLFGIANTTDSDGTGRVRAQSFSGALSGGVTGGAVIATANDVVSAINGNSGAGAISTAALAAGNDGYKAVTAFEDSAFTGSVEKSNRLQFLSPAGGPDIRFTSTPGTSLGVDLTSAPRVEGFSALTIQGAAADSSLVFTSRLTGTEYDGYKIEIVDDANVTAGNELVTVDKENKTLKFTIDNGNSTAENLRAALENDDYASQFFRATHFGTSDGSGVLTVADGAAAANAAARTTGGLTSAGKLVINLKTDSNGLVKTTANDLIAFFNDPSKFVSDSTELANTVALLSDYGISVSNAQGSSGSGLLEPTTADAKFTTSGTSLTDAQASGTTFAVNGTNAQIKFTAVTAGATYDNINVVFQSSASVTKGNETAAFDATSKTLTIQIDDGNTTAADVEGIFTNGSGNYNAAVAALFTADAQGTGAGVLTNLDTTKLTGGVVDSGSVQGAALLGNEDSANSGLTFRSSEFGSNQFVSVKALSGTFNVVDKNSASATRATGSDIIARINGIQAVGKGRQASVNTSSLDLSFTVASTVADGATFSFNITGGGALFQLGPDVVSNQQARLGIQSVSTATLGGVNGRLFELRSGGNKALDIDAKGAAKIVEEVISSVTKLRGRLGAFQRTTLETNIYTLNDTLANLTDAESSIRDADFAAESANLTRSQILVQSGTSVLSIANSNPQNVLSLLRG